MHEVFRLIPGNAQDVGSRSEQQDSFGFSDAADREFLLHGGLLVVVADGMGGLAGGNVASRVAVDRFLKAYGGKAIAEPVPEAMLRSLRVANEAVLVAAGQHGQQGAVGNMGTTLTAAVVVGRRLYWVSVGDSRLYLLRAGRLTQISTDHTYGTSLGRAVAEGRMDRDEAIEELERNESLAGHLTSYVGRRNLAQIDWTKRGLPLESGDVVVLCTDGIYRTLSATEIAAGFAAGFSAGDGCAEVLEDALEKRRAQQDNLTIAAIGCRTWADGEVGFAMRPVPASGAGVGCRRLFLAMVCCVAMVVSWLLFWLVPGWVGERAFSGKAAVGAEPGSGTSARPLVVPVSGRKKPSAGKPAVEGVVDHGQDGHEVKAVEPGSLDRD